MRARQIEKLERLKAERDPQACEQALDTLTEVARTGEGNLLAAAVDAARAKATVGEISLALEHVWNRHVAKIRAISKVYAEAAHGARGLRAGAWRACGPFQERWQPPRILVAKIGQDGHDRGQKVIASAFADHGLRRDDRRAVRDARRSGGRRHRGRCPCDRHFLAHRRPYDAHSRPEAGARWRAGADDIAIVVGGIVPPEDVAALKEMGVLAVFPPGTPIPAAAESLLDRLNERLGYAQKAAE